MKGNILLLLSVLAISFACSNKETNTDASNEEQITDGTPFNIVANRDPELVIAHQVEEYELWKASFDLAESVREKYGVVTKKVYQGIVDTSLTVVIANVENLDTAKFYLNSEKLYKSMENAGVKGKIETFYLQDRLEYKEEVTDTILMFMSFKVIKYDRWQQAFLEDYKEDNTRNFQVLKVMQGVENDDEVALLFVVNDPDYVKKMEGNGAFRMKMIQAGVISYPVIYKLTERII
jgi:arginine/lysine/ornithine decarboxylase